MYDHPSKLTINTQLFRVSLHARLISQNDGLEEVTQTDAVLSLQQVVQTVIEQHQLRRPVPPLADKYCNTQQRAGY